MKTTLIRISIYQDLDDAGQARWFVTPYYNRGGITMSVPDDRGWESETDARNEADRIRNR